MEIARRGYIYISLSRDLLSSLFSLDWEKLHIYLTSASIYVYFLHKTTICGSLSVLYILGLDRALKPRVEPDVPEQMVRVEKTRPCRVSLPNDVEHATRNRETMATESTHPKTLKSSRAPRRGSRLGSSWLWWGGWRCGQWLRGWWGWKLRGGGCSSRFSEAPPWHLAASNPSRWGCKQQPCPFTSVAFRFFSALPALPSADASFHPRASVVDLFPTSRPWPPGRTARVYRKENRRRGGTTRK